MQRRRNNELIILRGMPGSGKSRLAREIVDNSTVDGEIFSADDYFRLYENGPMVDFHPTLLHRAHIWNREEVFNAIQHGVPLIVVDNTNLGKWEMWPYVYMGFWHRYFITIEETDDIPLPILYRWNEGRISMNRLGRMRARYEQVNNIWEVLNDPECEERWMRTNEWERNNGWW